MNGRTTLGIILALVGLGLLLEQAGLVDVGEIASTWWPLILVVIGALKLLTGTRFGGLVLVLAGVLFQLHSLDLLPGVFFDYFWPLALIFLGAWLVASRSGRTSRVSLDEHMRQFVILGGLETRNESEHFEGGEVTVMLGGLDLDLRGARITGDRAVIDITAVLGGVEIRVPREWRVVASGTPLLGGWEDKSEHREEPGRPSPTLELRGIAVLGGVEVGN